MTREAERPVFVLGCSWRCGSTFLQRYINSTREVFVWGENDALAEKILNAVQVPEGWRPEIERQQEDFDYAGDHAWVALLNPPVNGPEILRSVLRLVYEAPAEARGIRRWGFKEIRHSAEIASVLLECFPDGRVVTLVRHPRACVASISGTGWLKEWGGVRPADLWTRNAKSFLGLSDSRVHMVKLEDFEDAPERTTARLGAHLGIAPDRFSVDVLWNVLRGTGAPPRFGPEEAEHLSDPELKTVARELGYRDV